MRNILYLLCVLLFVGCDSFEEINDNPNSTTKVPSEFLATNLILGLNGSSKGRALTEDGLLMKQFVWTELQMDYSYNKFGRSSFGAYRNFTNADKLIEIAEADGTVTEGQLNAYKGLRLFYRAYILYNATMEMGDVPCSDILKGKEGIYKTAYDPQEKVFGVVLDNLDKAEEFFANATKLMGDPVFQGNPDMWRRTVNSFHLRVLNMLSKKTVVDGRNIKTEFEKVCKQPLIEDEFSSFRRDYSASISKQYYPYHNTFHRGWYDGKLSQFLVNMLKDYKDRRLFYFADPAEASTADQSSFEAYVGADATLPFSEINKGSAEGKFSMINAKYYTEGDAEPITKVSYTETQFILAEAAVRGWVTSETAKQHYENGVRAAMDFRAKVTPLAYRHGVDIDAGYINEYLHGAAAFHEDGTNEEKYELILNQKYIASVLQLRWNSYYDYRRTGYPKLPINPNTNMNEVKDKLPLRWMYPSSEYSQNKDNVEAALQRQFGGTDTPNEVIWLLK